MTKPYYISASIECSNLLELGKELKRLEKAKIDFIHVDVMDGMFVPRYGINPKILRYIKSATSIPTDVHMMVMDPEPHIENFAKSGADIISVHAENNPHLHRTISMIRKAGARPGVVLNPATSEEVLKYVIEDIDLVMIMGINPGVVGHGLIKSTMEKAKKIKEMVKDREDFLIQVDGGVKPHTASKWIKNGANMLVCGNSTIFRSHEGTVLQKTSELKKRIDKELKE